ncbi:MAG TPA: hypothetical protein VG937_01055 [Polyangiaceae bacterium]|nr:hypothetical protein [Polyangiaceae bacterium]
MLEIDSAAESVLDARVVRRLVPLELSDIDLPPDLNARTPALFYRVLGEPERQVRVELWERGTLFDVRVVSGAQSGGHLLARRVALAAAELARRLRQKRLVQKREHDRELERLRTLAALAAARTREGPLALRAEFSAARTRQLSLLGPALTAEFTLRRALRLDLGAEYLGGWDDSGRALLSFVELSVGPALRVRAAPRLDVDFAARASASAVHVAGASAIDAIEGERDTWTARGGLALRVQPRLARWARASAGAEAGFFLRTMPARFPDGAGERFRGWYLGLALGVVITPL